MFRKKVTYKITYDEFISNLRAMFIAHDFVADNFDKYLSAFIFYLLHSYDHDVIIKQQLEKGIADSYFNQGRQLGRDYYLIYFVIKNPNSITELLNIQIPALSEYITALGMAKVMSKLVRLKAIEQMNDLNKSNAENTKMGRF